MRDFNPFIFDSLVRGRIYYMIDFIEKLNAMPDPKVLFLDEKGGPILRLSQKGIEYLDRQIFLGKDTLPWDEIESVHIVATRVKACHHLTPRLKNFGTKKKQLPINVGNHLDNWFHGAPVLLSHIHSLRIQNTNIIFGQRDSQYGKRFWLFHEYILGAVFERFAALQVLFIEGEDAHVDIYAERYNQLRTDDFNPTS